MVRGANGAGRIGLWLSIAISGAVIISMVGAMFYVAFSTKANTDSITDQRATDEKFNTALHDIQLKQNSLEVALNEIETQFCADDIVRNLMHASDQRISSLLWQKTFPETHIPTDNAYYPTICNRRTK